MKFVDARSSEKEKRAKEAGERRAAAAAAAPAGGAVSGFDAHGGCTLQGQQGGSYAAPASASPKAAKPLSAAAPLSAAGAASSLPPPLSDKSPAQL